MNNHFWKSKILVAFVIALFSLMMAAETMPQTAGADPRVAAQGQESNAGGTSGQAAENDQSAPATVVKNKETTAPAAQLGNEEANSFPMVKEKVAAPKAKKKKKFPWLWVAAGALLVGVAVYFIVAAGKKYTLTTTVGTGVSGQPAAGSVKYKKGSVVNYSFSAASGYMDLVVTLDGAAVAASGTVKMDKNHTLSATAKQSFVLTVTKSNGVNGTPETGTYTYASGTSVSYSYAEISGYTNLVVKIDDVAAAVSGTVIMNGNHTLTASATQAVLYKLTVTSTYGSWRIADWNPAQGVYYYYGGTEIHYSYTGNSSSAGLIIVLNGVTLFDQYGENLTASGSFILNGKSTLDIMSH